MAKHPLFEIESLFDELAGPTRKHAVDITEADDEFRVSIDLPGFDAEDITIRTTDHTLHIEAEHEAESKAEEEEETYLRKERRRRSVARTIQLPETINESEAEATYKNGVLTVAIPKEVEAQEETHTIPIND